MKMSCEPPALMVSSVRDLQAYHPSKPVDELQAELNCDRIVKLASNENPLGPSPRVFNAIANEKNISRYPEGGGVRLKRLLAEKYQLDPAQITLGNGSNEILEIIARSFISSTDAVIYSKYSFSVYAILVQAIGARHIIVPTLGWHNDCLAILDHIDDQTKLIFLANPNNPTGTMIARDSLRQLLESVPEHILLVIDEAYFEYAAQVEEYPDTSLWLEDFKQLIIVRTFSKIYGLAGLRVGYALSHPDIAKVLNLVRQPFNNNMLGLQAAEVALADTAHVQESIEINTAGMAQLIHVLQNLGIAFIPSVANFLTLDFAESATNIYKALLQEGVIVRPLDNYQMPNHLRVSIGLEQENAHFLDALQRI